MALASEFSLGTVEVALSPRERFAEFLRTRGKRITRQREAIVDHVASHHEHFDAEQLLAGLRRTPAGARASRPTVYRTLAEMVEAGLLRKMVLAGRAVYEHDYGYPQHEHLVCDQCDTMIEFQNAEIEEILRKVAAQHKFRAEGHTLVVRGICQSCNAANAAKRRPYQMG